MRWDVLKVDLNVECIVFVGEHKMRRKVFGTLETHGAGRVSRRIILHIDGVDDLKFGKVVYANTVPASIRKAMISFFI